MPKPTLQKGDRVYIDGQGTGTIKSRSLGPFQQYWVRFDNGDEYEIPVHEIILVDAIMEIVERYIENQEGMGYQGAGLREAAAEALEWGWKKYRSDPMPAWLSNYPSQWLHRFEKIHKQEQDREQAEVSQKYNKELDNEAMWEEWTEYLKPENKVKAYQEAIKSEDYERAEIILNDMTPEERAIVSRTRAFVKHKMKKQAQNQVLPRLAPSSFFSRGKTTKYAQELVDKRVYDSFIVSDLWRARVRALEREEKQPELESYEIIRAAYDEFGLKDREIPQPAMLLLGFGNVVAKHLDRDPELLGLVQQVGIMDLFTDEPDPFLEAVEKYKADPAAGSPADWWKKETFEDKDEKIPSADELEDWFRSGSFATKLKKLATAISKRGFKKEAKLIERLFDEQI